MLSHLRLLKETMFLLLTCGVLFSAAAWSPPPLTARVVDQVSLLDQEAEQRVDQAIRDFETATGGQLFVAILKPLDDVTIEEAGIKLMDAWKPGQKGKDNGAILLIVPEQRKMRLEIGYGWEGEVNDAKAGDIIRGMTQYFRENRFADGILAAIGKLAEDITGKPLPEVQVEEPLQINDNSGIWVVFFFVIVTLILFFRSGRTSSGGHGGDSFGGGNSFGGGGGGFSGGGGGGGGGGGASGSW